jgi:hypothetical protein
MQFVATYSTIRHWPLTNKTFSVRWLVSNSNCDNRPTPTVRNYSTIVTCQFRIPNTSIYLSFRAAQDHKAAIRLCRHPLQPDGMIWWQQRGAVVVFAFSLAIVFVLVSLVMNYIVVELLLFVVNYIVDFMIYMCVWCVCYIMCLFWKLPIWGGSWNRLY